TDGEAEVLLPKKYLPADKVVGDSMEVFVYLDSEDRPVATTRKPYGTVGEMKVMTVVDANNIGAFVDWGLEKDLLVPFKHQKQHLVAGKSYPIIILFDEVSRRIIGSNCLEKYFLNYPGRLKENDEVHIVVYSESDLGYNVLVDKEFIGMIYRNEVFRKLEPGDHLRAYVKKVREDGKLDI
ncbi:MAG: S1-like domain-containing RNA-binding protein, partial [Victivallaceae bacterium]